MCARDAMKTNAPGMRRAPLGWVALAVAVWAIYVEEYRLLLLAGIAYVIWRRSTRPSGPRLTIMDGGRPSGAPSVMGTGTTPGSGGPIAPATTVESSGSTVATDGGCT